MPLALGAAPAARAVREGQRGRLDARRRRQAGADAAAAHQRPHPLGQALHGRRRLPRRRLADGRDRRRPDGVHRGLCPPRHLPRVDLRHRQAHAGLGRQGGPALAAVPVPRPGQQVRRPVRTPARQPALPGAAVARTHARGHDVHLGRRTVQQHPEHLRHRRGARADGRHHADRADRDDAVGHRSSAGPCCARRCPRRCPPSSGRSSRSAWCWPSRCSPASTSPTWPTRPTRWRWAWPRPSCPASIDRATVTSPYALLDKFNDDASAQVSDIMKDAGIMRLDLLLAAAVFSIGSVIFLCGGGVCCCFCCLNPTDHQTVAPPSSYRRCYHLEISPAGAAELSFGVQETMTKTLVLIMKATMRMAKMVMTTMTAMAMMLMAMMKMAMITLMMMMMMVMMMRRMRRRRKK